MGEGSPFYGGQNADRYVRQTRERSTPSTSFEPNETTFVRVSYWYTGTYRVRPTEQHQILLYNNRTLSSELRTHYLLGPSGCVYMACCRLTPLVDPRNSARPIAERPLRDNVLRLSPLPCSLHSPLNSISWRMYCIRNRYSLTFTYPYTYLVCIDCILHHCKLMRALLACHLDPTAQVVFRGFVDIQQHYSSSCKGERKGLPHPLVVAGIALLPSLRRTTMPLSYLALQNQLV